MELTGSHGVQKQRNASLASHEKLSHALWENREKVDKRVKRRRVVQCESTGFVDLPEFSRESSEQPQDLVASTSFLEIASGTIGAEAPVTSHDENQECDHMSSLVLLENEHSLIGQKSLDSLNHYDLDLSSLGLESIVNNMIEVDLSETCNENLRMGYKIFERSDPISSVRRRPLGRQSDPILPRNLPFDYIPVTCNSEALYFGEFYNNLAKIIQPLRSYHKDYGYYCATRDIILEVASNDACVLSAILAQGARMSYEKHGLKEDEEASYKYMMRCLKLFKPALLRIREDHDLLNNKVESVFLTILILASANAYNLNTNWRSHLRGAKELLLKHGTTSKKGQDSMSRVMVFCKYWYVSFEIVAGLSSRRGRTLWKDLEMDLILSTSHQEMQILKEIGILRPDGFNLLLGIHHSCLTPIRDLIKFLNRVRNNGSSSNTLEIIELLSRFNDQLKIKFVFLEGTARMENFQRTKLHMGSLLDSTKVPSGKIIISWMDISHQSHVLASMVILLRKGLQFTSHNEHVQVLNRGLLNLVSFLVECHDLSSNSKDSMILLQWPILIAGLNCARDEERLITMKFFRHLAFGTKNSTYALRKLNKVWKSPNEFEEKSDCLYSSDVDITSH